MDLTPNPDRQPPLDLNTGLPNGAPCTSSMQCQSGNCITGSCCDTVCNGVCFTCVLPGLVGTCTQVPAGQDPYNQCNEDPVSSCGKDGACNGQGACRLFQAGVFCSQGQCDQLGSKIIGIKKCDGNGNCINAPEVSCFPYRCEPSSNVCHTSCTYYDQWNTCYGYYACNISIGKCNSSCKKDNDCKPGGHCDKGQCKAIF